MALYYNLPVYKASYKLVGLLFSSSNNFSREYKYTVGQELKDEGLYLIKNIYRANKAMDKTVHIGAARENLEAIRLFLRLMQDFNQLGLKIFVEINLSIESVSKQLTAWEKYCQAKLKAEVKSGIRKQIVSQDTEKNNREEKATPESSVARAQTSVHSNSNNPLALLGV